MNHATPTRVSGGAKRKKSGPLLPAALCLIALGLLAHGLWIAPDKVAFLRSARDGLAQPLLWLLGYLGIGLLAGQALESLGWAPRLAVLARPLMRLGRLGDESGAAFSAAFVSNLMANSMLVTAHHEGRLSREEMTLAYLVNTGLPVFVAHLPTTFFVIVPLVREAGAAYLAICLLAAILKSVAVLAYCRFRLSPGRRPAVTEAPRVRKDARSLGRDVWAKFKRRFARATLFSAPVYVVIFILSRQGFFDALRDRLAAWLSVGFFPVEAAGVVVFSLAAEFTSGAAAAGALLAAGSLTVKQTVLAMLVGTIAAAPIRALRHQLPSQAGLFSPGLALKQLLLSQTLRAASLILVAMPYLLWA